MNPRAVAANLLSQVIVDQRSLTPLLDSHKEKEAERALIQEFCYGVLRWYPRLNALSKLLLKKPLKTQDFSLHLLVLIGLYQILYMRIPDHAAVMETVNAVKSVKKKYKKERWPSQLINGVLRNFLRHRDELLKTLEESEKGRFSHPQWLIEKIRSSWPDYWENILEANNQHPPMTLRINIKKTERDEYIKILNKHDISARIIPYNSCGLTLDKPVDIKKLPGFLDGKLSVQDAAPQMAADLLDLKPNLRVLDACAAPGGKTAHILESQDSLDELVVLEKDPERAKKITENLVRLKLNANSKQKKEINTKIDIIIGDATKPESWWDGDLFDRILLDAPCSATGVIRRHPDIKLLRTSTDIESLANLQLQMLNVLWPLLKPGGLLVYATCSIMPEENTLNIERFLKSEKILKDGNAIEKIVEENLFPWGVKQKYGRQILPGDSGLIAEDKAQLVNMDGFYYCVLEKRGFML